MPGWTRRHDARRTAPYRRHRRLRRRQPGVHRGAVPPLLRGQPEAVQRVYDPTSHHRHAGQRNLDAVRLPRAEPHHLHRLHLVHRRHRLRVSQHSGGVLDTHGRRRRRCAHRAADPARIHADADHDARAGTTSRSAPRVPSPATATASSSPKAPGSSSSKSMEQARARGAQIYGEIAGYGSTCEAYHRVRLEECGEEPARAIGLALEEGGHRVRKPSSTSTTTARPPN